MKKILYMHGGSKNHGCEAIVRTTIDLLGEDITLLSNKPDEDNFYGLDDICNVEKADINVKRFSLMHFYVRFLLFISKKLYIRKCTSNIIKHITEGDLCFSIGGDNYCYESVIDTLKFLNMACNKKRAKTILWGCSIEPDLLMDNQVINDMKRYSLITARESITYNALYSAGVTSNIKLIPDPAFLLKAVYQKLPEGFLDNNTIGINISPMIIDYEKKSGITRLNVTELMKYILNNSNSNIALIPHVVRNGSNDLAVLQSLYDEFKHSKRVVLINDCNCMELKGYIARCRLFIGARTHATIAAYSSCVPTLVIGYSVKSKGIATDIFGSIDNYVLPVQNLKNPHDLVQAYQWLSNHEDEIRHHLKQFMPAYCNKAYQAADEVKKLLGE